MMAEVGYLTALLGGLLALLSPCSALLLPAFFAYAFATPGRLLARTAAFWVGLCVTLVPLGVAGSLAGSLLTRHRETLVAVGGWAVIGFGLAQMLGFGFGSRRMAEAAARLRPSSVLSVALLGAVYGLAGFCAGPILGGILMISALHGSPAYGGVLLAVYALGMAAPLFVLALLWERFDLGRRRLLRGRELKLGRLRLHTTSLLSGLLFVAVGGIFLTTGGTASLSAPLGVDQEARLEEWVLTLGDGVSDVMLLIPLTLLVAGALLWRLRRGSTAAAEEPEGEPAADSDREGGADRPTGTTAKARLGPSDRTGPTPP
ncbi:cytochrome c biogenesis protein CcdA [Streptomyces sp. OF3]|uniref:Cytochrome c biogenesis protein CcdA n=2 Tax=Streptomyces alkaliterrae TaxID=2213162 RepID=A0A7W3WPW1_9ACTN|nr:cytochrome c biogenesis CcdA family protein [Streptomyces alkaliterrae]MBB1256328.1 cytochrome c biogenesis protein CcdA [Streptomyces alkaliterrae]